MSRQTIQDALMDRHAASPAVRTTWHGTNTALSIVTVVLAVATALPIRAYAADDPISSVMGSIEIASGQHAGSVTDVNGSIHIGAAAVVGQASTVNGSIKVEERVSAISMSTVNGSIHIGPGSHVSGVVSTVNGSINLEAGTDISGSVSTVNGMIRVNGAHVGGGITSVSGDIDIGANSRVEGGLHVLPSSGTAWFSFFFSHTPSRIVIGPGAVVSGTLRFEQDVKLYVSDHATIGKVEGATPIKFSGAHPPD